RPPSGPELALSHDESGLWKEGHSAGVIKVEVRHNDVLDVIRLETTSGELDVDHLIRSLVAVLLVLSRPIIELHPGIEEGEALRMVDEIEGHGNRHRHSARPAGHHTSIGNVHLGRFKNVKLHGL